MSAEMSPHSLDDDSFRPVEPNDPDNGPSWLRFSTSDEIRAILPRIRSHGNAGERFQRSNRAV